MKNKKIIFIFLGCIIILFLMILFAFMKNNNITIENKEEDLKEKYNISRDVSNLTIEEMTSNEVMYITEKSEYEKEQLEDEMKKELIENIK